MEIYRFPNERLLRTPGSTTTRDRLVSCDIDTHRVAFCGTENIGTPNLSYGPLNTSPAHSPCSSVGRARRRRRTPRPSCQRPVSRSGSSSLSRSAWRRPGRRIDLLAPERQVAHLVSDQQLRHRHGATENLLYAPLALCGLEYDDEAGRRREAHLPTPARRDEAVAQEKYLRMLTRLVRHPRRGARARIRPRIASCALSGAQAFVSSSARATTMHS
jgi:hypothetical protein